MGTSCLIERQGLSWKRPTPNCLTARPPRRRSSSALQKTTKVPISPLGEHVCTVFGKDSARRPLQRVSLLRGPSKHRVYDAIINRYSCQVVPWYRAICCYTTCASGYVT